MRNLTTNKHNSRMVLNKGLATSQEESSGLNLRGDNGSSPLLDAIEYNQMILNLIVT